MKKTKIISFAHGLVLLPLVSMSVPGMPQGIQSTAKAPEVVFAEKAAAILGDKEDAGAAEIEKKAEAINAYFKKYGMPLEGQGEKLATEAMKNGLDWRLLAAISVRESTGGKHACKRVPNNPFGWGSCKISFESMDKAIETVGHNLGGNNPRTAHHYDNKTTLQILRAYNPPSIVPKYAEQVIAIMNAIGPQNLGESMELAEA